MRPRHCFLLAFVVSLSSGLLAAAPRRPESIPSPRPDGWLVDETGTLGASEIADLNALADEVHAHDGAELAIVVIPTTVGAEHRQFATNLFNEWGIGDRDRNNGLLVFVALDDRAAEIILGDGIDSDVEVTTSEHIMQNVMVPQFRDGKNAAAIVAGTRACAQEFFDVSFGSRIDITPMSARNLRRWWFGGGLTALAMVVFGWNAALSYWRSRPRRCRRCSMMMERLDETSDDAHLSAAEQTEERIDSVDYDIWHCPGCNGIEKFRYGKFFSDYSNCPQCGAKTLSTNHHTIVAATTLSTGRMRIDEKCEACDYKSTSERVIPTIKEKSESGSSSGFGGGHSSGRGASGRW